MNDFSLDNPIIMFYLFLAGPMTVIPLFLFIKGVEKCGLSASGMIFLLPQLVNFYWDISITMNLFSTDKFISFILIWICINLFKRFI